MITDEIRAQLYDMRDTAYRDFQIKLIPAAEPGSVIGVRTPKLRKLAKQIIKRNDAGAFLSDLPHLYFDENQLHAFIISEIKDFDRCVERLCEFLPYIDNWATCDQTSPKVFKKHREELFEYIKLWIVSDEVYPTRFAIKMLMEHFLDEDFDIRYPELVSRIRSDEYYVNMMIAWYFATALAKQYESVLPFMEGKRLDAWTHNKSIQKSIESRRIDPEKKEYLRSLKIK